MSLALNLLLMVGTASVMSLRSVGLGNNEWFLAASLFNLAVGTAGIMIRDPRQWFVVGAIVLIEVSIFLPMGHFDAGELGINSAILYPFYALSMGVAAASAQRMLLRRASVVDHMQQVSLHQAVSIKTASDINSYVEMLKRAIHETVLNTLTAISRGSLRKSEESRSLIRSRAQESARILSDLSHPAVPVSATHIDGVIAPLHDLLVECAERGIDVRLLGNVEAVPPAHMIAEITAGAREAIINALRHSELTELTIRVHGGSKFCVEIIDNGVGFDEKNITPGFGLSTLLASNSIMSVDIESDTPTGSTVRIYPTKILRGRAANRLAPGTPTLPLVLPILSAWFAFSALSIVLTWSQFDAPFYNVLALLLYAAVIALMIQQSRSGPLTAVSIGAGLLGAVLIYYLAGQSQARIGTPWTQWSSEAIGVLFLSLAAAGTWWAWIAVGSVWMLIQQNFPLEFIAPGFLIIMAGAFLGMQLRRTDRVRSTALSQLTADAVSIALSERLSAAKIEKALGVVPPTVIDLLEGIAAGSRDPWEQSVQSECGIAESHLRRTIFGGSIHPDPIATLSRELSRRALSHGLLLDFSLDVNCHHVGELDDISEYLQRLMLNLPPGSTARFSSGCEGSHGVLRFVAHTSANKNHTELVELCESVPWGNAVMLAGEDDACEFLWEVTFVLENT